SAFRKDAVSPVGAVGLGQLMPGTAARLGVQNAYDPVDNLQGCARLLGQDLSRYRDLTWVVAAYNAGEGAVEKYRGIPPYAETQRYVQKITGLYNKARHPYDEHAASPSSLIERIARARRGPGGTDVAS